MKRLNKFTKQFRKTKIESTSKSLMTIKTVLDESRDFKIDVEVVFYALMYMRDNPKCQISDAMIASITQWI